MMLRTVRKIVTGNVQYDGAGVKLVRVIGHPDTEDFDPFLMLDAFDSADPADYIKGFPWHPHRGIETVTYLIRGRIEHGDSLGNKGTIDDGCCQWMTAGGGILHQEMPQASERLLGVQLWLNLPAKDKMTDPKYHDIRAGEIPKAEGDGSSTAVISGHYKGVSGPARGEHVAMTFFDVSLEGGAAWSWETPRENTVFAYIVEGEGWFAKTEDRLHYSRRAVLFSEGDAVFARASGKGMRFLLFAGPPLREPIAWGGPIVMNTQEELDEAFSQIRSGTFVRKPVQGS